ncbi:MAG TPA: transketolase [Patescibacteria group bacterium]|nr:transketolase [Patescibacteria group bacterium]
MPINDREITSLKEHARSIRRAIIKLTTHAGAGHLGGALSVADILTYLYFNALKLTPRMSRDRLYLSAGHLCPTLYATLYELGEIDEKELLTYGQFGTRLQGHPSKVDWPAMESASGSLGQGLSLALGAALAYKLDRKTGAIYCVMSDGEQEEGSVWEAAMAAAHYRTDNLIAIVDRNKLQISGSTENVIGLAPLGTKYRAFGWHVIDCDGHDFASLDHAVSRARQNDGPTAIIAETVMGKGIKSIENNAYWHSRIFDRAQAAAARKELT